MLLLAFVGGIFAATAFALATGVGERAGTVVIDDETHRLADRLADPAHREQQDGRSDGDENIVEAGDQAKMFFVDAGQGPLRFDESAKRRGGVGTDRARRHRLVEIVLAVHGYILPEWCRVA